MTTEYTGPEFVLILREGTDEEGKPTLEAAGVSRPEEFIPNSPAHVVGRFIGQNMGLLASMAVRQAEPPPETPAVIGPDRERTILLPGG